jgi:cytochrome c553
MTIQRRKTMKKLLAIAISSLLLSTSASVFADADAGKELFMNNCDKCHEDGGATAVPDDDIEPLLGLKRSDLEQRLADVKSGKTKTPKKMKKRMKKLSEAELNDILDYLARGK